MKKALLILVVLLGGYGAWAYASRFNAETAGSRPEIPHRSRRSADAIIASVSATGTVTATTTVIVGSQLSGQVVEILVDHNSEVKAGQLLARLNSDTIAAKRDAARADLRQAQAARRLDDAQAEKARADSTCRIPAGGFLARNSSAALPCWRMPRRPTSVRWGSRHAESRLT